MFLYCIILNNIKHIFQLKLKQTLEFWPICSILATGLPTSNYIFVSKVKLFPYKGIM